MNTDRSPDPENMLRTYGGLILIDALKIVRDHHLAEDCLQETLARVIGAQRRGLKVKFDAAWVLEVGRNVARVIKARRDRARSMVEEGRDPSERGSPAPPPDEMARRAEDVVRIEHAAAELPPELGRPFMMWARGHLSCVEIAIRLGLSKSAMATRIKLAHESIRRRLADH